MLTLRYARQTRAFLFSRSAFNAAPALLFSSTSAAHPIHRLTPNPIDSSGFQSEIQRGEIVHYFRDWFMSRKNPLHDRIFQILRTHEESSLDSALASLNLYLVEPLILDVLRYDQKDVLCCLKFFDWAGRQPGFHHTRATFTVMFRILSKAKLMGLMLEFLETYEKQRYVHKVRYHNILVIGYAIAGKCETALVVFGKMRFIGIDLDQFSYHVLLNSLVEHGLFDIAETVKRHIAARGLQTDITHSISIKSLCLQNKLEEAARYLYDLAQDENNSGLNGIALGTFVDALCKHNQFEKAAMLVEEFREKGLVPMEHAYGVWIRDLVIAGKLDGALEFLKDKQAVEGYVPDIYRYNLLIGKLLRENRLDDVFDLLVDMKERDVVPDDFTMNAILSVLCKAGRMDIALDLYDARAEFSLSVNYMAYNYLINSLVGGVNVSEAYRVLRSSIEYGYTPGQKTLSIIADDLCREGRLDEMKDLVLFAIDQKIMPDHLAYDKFISALCRASRIEEGYLIHDMLNHLNIISGRTTYMKLIRGLIQSNRSDIAVRLFIEMLDRGFKPSRKLAREVISCLLKGKNRENQFFGCLEMLIGSNRQSAHAIYNFFIDGAGKARRPELASKVYEMMETNGVEPKLSSCIVLLCSYLNAGQIAQALYFFRNSSKRLEGRKLWRAMVVGLSRAGRPEYASQILDDMRAQHLKPSIECYEELIKAYCGLEQYDKAIEIVNYMTKRDRPISSFIGNVFLFHALKGVMLYETWAHLSHKQTLSPSCWMLGHIIGVFSGAVKEIYDEGELERMIHQCFDITTYTNNMLLKRMCLKGMEHACEYFNKLCALGFEPNRHSYLTMIHGFARRGQFDEARKWVDEMLGKGFHLTEVTMRVI